MKRRLSLACVLAVSLSAATSGVARADVALGTVAIPTGSAPHSCLDNKVIAQPSSDPATPYTVPAPGGTITQWQTNSTLDAPGEDVSFLVLRSTGATTWSVVGEDTRLIPNPVPDVSTFTLSSPIAVSGGEILAIYTDGVGAICYLEDGVPFSNSLISLDGPTPPTAGDSVALNDTSGPGFRLNLAATLTQPSSPAPPAAPKKKKCKKHKKKHKRSAESAKKKHKKKCKKKKKRH